jgi:hypothetical protein
MEANGGLERMARTPCFTERPDEDEYLRTAPLDEVADYLREKYPNGQ